MKDPEAAGLAQAKHSTSVAMCNVWLQSSKEH